MVARVQIAPAGVGNAASSAASTFSADVTAGNTLIVTAMKHESADSTPFALAHLSKTAGTATLGTIALDVQKVGTGVAGLGSKRANAAIYRIPVTGSGSLTLTITASANSYILLEPVEYSGLAASPLEGTSTNENEGASGPGSAVSPITSGNVTTAGAGLMVGVTSSECNVNTTFGTLNNSFSQVYKNETTTDNNGAVADRIVGSGTTSGLSWDQSASNAWVAVAASYAAASGSSAVAPAVYYQNMLGSAH